MSSLDVQTNRSTANQNLAVFRINYFNEKQTICHKKTVVELQGILLWHVKKKEQ